MLKNKLIAIILTAMLILPVYAEPETILPAAEKEMLETIYPENSQSQEIVTTEETQEDVASVPPENVISPYKQPVSKKKIIKKFLLAMMGVAGSSILIFAFLSLYNRVRDSFRKEKNQDLPEIDGESSLETPYTLTEAVKTFLDKTKWE